MRVLHVIQEMRTGGAERIVAALVNGARRHGHEVALAAGPGAVGDSLGIERYPLPIIARRPWRLPSALRAVRQAIRSFRPDLVHSHNPGMAAVCSLATRQGRRPRAIVSFHGVPDEDYRSAARVLRCAGLPVIACGPGVASAVAAHHVAVHTTIVNGVSPPPPAADRSKLESEWGVSPGHRLIVAVGRLVPQKNHSLAVRAMPSVDQATLAILGEGDERQRLAAEIDALGVGDRVILAGARPDARAVMAAADVVVLTSHWEGLPLVALEALAAGTPLVATSVRGIRELVSAGIDSLLVPPDDPIALGEALRHALDDGDLRARLVASGHRLAAQHTEQAMVGDFLQLYQEMAGQ